jgi:phosphoribosyl-ATP pyrophosphohydrolase
VPTTSRSQSRPLDKLERTIAARAANPKEKSYTTQLLAGGVPKIGAKITEEAAEVVEAAGEVAAATGPEHFIREAADLVYHLLVLLRYKNCTLADVEAELARRFGVSGIEEKASRGRKKPAAAKSTKTTTRQPRKKKPTQRKGRK